EEAGSFLAIRVDAPPQTGAPASDAFQTGRTDREGRFVFRPHVAGVWKISIDDEMGHRATTEVSVPEQESGQQTPLADSTDGGPRSTSDKLLVGLSLLFGVTGMLMAWVTRRSARQG
nr:hypothetical protein [Bryobacterales bacterium]